MATRSSKSHGCKKRMGQIHLYTSPMAERRSIPSVSIGTRLDWRAGQSTSTTSPRLTSVMMHLTDSDYDRKAQSTWEASIPINKQDHSVNDLIINHQQMLLLAFNELKAKRSTSYSDALEDKTKNTLDPAVQQHLEWLSLNWKTHFASSSSSTWTESPLWWSSSSSDHQWQEWHSQGEQDKERRDQQQPRQRLSRAQTSTRKLVRWGQSKRSQLLSMSPESRLQL